MLSPIPAPGTPALHTDAFIPYMRNVTRCETSLRELNLMWRLIESSAKMNCPQEAHAILPMMSATRSGFEQLEQDLVQSMVQQSVAGVMAGLATQAQHVIDTLVRNLYERTADVGFLATDSVLCHYVAGLSDGTGVQERLQAYRSKYTVYNEILLVGLDGTVLAQTDGDSPVEGSQDSLLAQTLESSSYVETFRYTDLRPHQSQALLYSHRMLHPQTHEPVGLLCLSFDFEGEMQGIFSSRSRSDAGATSQGAHSVALLVNGEGCTLSSSDIAWIAPGVTVPMQTHNQPQLHVHTGRTYLVQTVASAGYQGYPGPAGWHGQVMIPIEQAFATKDHPVLDSLDATVAQGLLAHADSFCPPLHAIVTAADTIRRVVWNGQVMTAGADSGSERLQAVLEQIGETGARTNEVFTHSIRGLYDTVLSTALRDNSLLSSLLVDLLDRNLYERANDCRWWALTPQLPALLESLALGNASAADLAQANAVLTHIHSLYTVYSQLVVYDRQGRIVAASAQSGIDLHSAPAFAPATVARVLALPHAQTYDVSPWQPCPLESQQTPTPRPTYTYHAAIRDAHGTPLGGIGLVFHAEREFHAMLASSVPPQSATRVLYVQRSGLVMASTDPDHPVGATLNLPEALLQLPAGASAAQAMEHAGQYCVVAATAGSGYREFKRSDGYREDVIAVAIQPFGSVQEDAIAAVRRRNTRIAPNIGQGGREMATFFVGSSLMALDAACVLEALPAASIAPVSAGRLPHCLGTLARRSRGALTGYVWVFDLASLLQGSPSKITAQSQVIVLEHGGQKVGVLVSDLQGVARFQEAQIIPAPAMAPADQRLLEALIKANDGTLLIQCLSARNVLQTLQSQAHSHAQQQARQNQQDLEQLQEALGEAAGRSISATGSLTLP